MARKTGRGKLPALQFYAGDWKKDAAVQSLDYYDRGVWFELLMAMHESPQRGRLVFPSGVPMDDDSLARLLGIGEADWKQIRSRLVARGVASEDADGTLYNRRMVRDERIRQAKIAAGRKGGSASKPEAKAKQTPSKGASKTQAKGGSSVSSSVSSSASTTTKEAVERLCESLGCDWGVKASIEEWAAEIERTPQYRDLDLPIEIDACREWYESKGKRPKAPDRAIRNWLKNARPPKAKPNRVQRREDLERTVSDIKAMLRCGGSFLTHPVGRPIALEQVQQKLPEEWRRSGEVFQAMPFPQLHELHRAGNDYALTKAIEAALGGKRDAA